MTFDFGHQFVAITLAMHGEDGEAWLHRLPSIIATCAEQWNLTLEPPFPHLSYNHATPARRRDGTPVVLKIGYPGNPEYVTETEALRLFAGRGSVALLDLDPANGAMLLERLEPGLSLSTVTDDVAATSIAAGVMRLLPRPAPPDHPFPTVAHWGLGFTRLRTTFDGGSGPFPAPLVDRAEHLFAELISSSAEPTLIHGDLHHGNILAASRAPWLAIDPKGLVGEPAYETGALLRNPLPDLITRPDGAHILTRRIDQLAEELDFDRTRLRAWAFSQAILSAWWTYEDNDGDWTPALRCAEFLLQPDKM
jgi:streptomycin 6-kinase